MSTDLTKLTEQQLRDYYRQLDDIEIKVARELHRRGLCTHTKTCTGGLDGRLRQVCLICGKTLTQ